jgi:hypothetical protein
MKDIEQIIAELRADGVEDESIFADFREADAYMKAHPEEFAEPRETLMELHARVMKEREARRNKRRRTK